ncbi:hypothetical protein HYH03_017241 [Edaphochlamys debaryana]|uniref:Uncharacterized protein n=1 Tax=Edaphochlamys debaryana TaxID=47281 RepID=A0A835XMZ3_9CHLO|nr:hypothetical protein HYH03_017241 [Edaphochlamys debaryana]|eukprot:KAG2483920.1 hypothetical protein HYH03_017241 [Edaphochlamys debaryana]
MQCTAGSLRLPTGYDVSLLGSTDTTLGCSGAGAYPTSVRVVSNTDSSSSGGVGPSLPYLEVAACSDDGPVSIPSAAGYAGAAAGAPLNSCPFGFTAVRGFQGPPGTADPALKLGVWDLWFRCGGNGASGDGTREGGWWVTPLTLGSSTPRQPPGLDPAAVTPVVVACPEGEVIISLKVIATPRAVGQLYLDCASADDDNADVGSVEQPLPPTPSGRVVAGSVPAGYNVSLADSSVLSLSCPGSGGFVTGVRLSSGALDGTLASVSVSSCSDGAVPLPSTAGSLVAPATASVSCAGGFTAVWALQSAPNSTAASAPLPALSVWLRCGGCGSSAPGGSSAVWVGPGGQQYSSVPAAYGPGSAVSSVVACPDGSVVSGLYALSNSSLVGQVWVECSASCPAAAVPSPSPSPSPSPPPLLPPAPSGRVVAGSLPAGYNVSLADSSVLSLSCPGSGGFVTGVRLSSGALDGTLASVSVSSCSDGAVPLPSTAGSLVAPATASVSCAGGFTAVWALQSAPNNTAASAPLPAWSVWLRCGGCGSSAPGGSSAVWVGPGGQQYSSVPAAYGPGSAVSSVVACPDGSVVSGLYALSNSSLVGQVPSPSPPPSLPPTPSGRVVAGSLPAGYNVSLADSSVLSLSCPGSGGFVTGMRLSSGALDGTLASVSVSSCSDGAVPLPSTAGSLVAPATASVSCAGGFTAVWALQSAPNSTAASAPLPAWSVWLRCGGCGSSAPGGSSAVWVGPGGQQYSSVPAAYGPGSAVSSVVACPDGSVVSGLYALSNSSLVANPPVYPTLPLPSYPPSAYPPIYSSFSPSPSPPPSLPPTPSGRVVAGSLPAGYNVSLADSSVLSLSCPGSGGFVTGMRLSSGALDGTLASVSVSSCSDGAVPLPSTAGSLVAPATASVSCAGGFTAVWALQSAPNNTAASAPLPALSVWLRCGGCGSSAPGGSSAVWVGPGGQQYSSVPAAYGPGSAVSSVVACPDGSVVSGLYALSNSSLVGQVPSPSPPPSLPPTPSGRVVAGSLPAGYNVSLADSSVLSLWCPGSGGFVTGMRLSSGALDGTLASVSVSSCSDGAVPLPATAGSLVAPATASVSCAGGFTAVWALQSAPNNTAASAPLPALSVWLRCGGCGSSAPGGSSAVWVGPGGQQYSSVPAAYGPGSAVSSVVACPDGSVVSGLYALSNSSLSAPNSTAASAPLPAWSVWLRCGGCGSSAPGGSSAVWVGPGGQQYSSVPAAYGPGSAVSSVVACSDGSVVSGLYALSNSSLPPSVLPALGLPAGLSNPPSTILPAIDLSAGLPN